MKLPFSPEMSSYSVKEGAGRLNAEQLGSPAPNVGKGIVNTAYEVRCKFILDAQEFDEFCDFLGDTHDPQSPIFGAVFTADLFLDESEIKEYTCKFDISTYKLAVKGEAHTIDVTILAQR